MNQHPSGRDWALSDEVRAVQANPRDFWAWLRLCLVVDTDERKRICLENALAIEPENVRGYFSVGAVGGVVSAW